MQSSRTCLVLSILLAAPVALATDHSQSPIGADEGRPRIMAEDAGRFHGEIAFVHGQVSGFVRKGRMNLLSFGPEDQPYFELAIAEPVARRFDEPLESYIGKNVRVRGWISDYAGRPQIRITEPGQIEVLDALPKLEPPANRSATSAAGFKVASFNILNLFDDVDDPYTSDETTPAKSRDEMKHVAEAIRRINPDVIALQEVENRGYLQRFVDVFLGDMGYENVVLLDGPDPRGIDVALVSRLPVGPVTSYQYARFPSAGETRTFERDLLSVRIEPPGHESFEVWVVHLKSNYDGRKYAEPIRIAEARKVREVLDARLADDPNARIVLCGDFNDTQDSATLKTILGSGSTAMFDTASALPDENRVTYNREPYRTQIDFLLLSPALKERYVPGSFDILQGSVETTGSDHNPISIMLNLSSASTR
ncbi:MAG: endonuclease/exonuclease/phosphatase family protein [Phycisphaerae bacterium]|nr:endonuclease/exonuclease/phosphatase family protein [Phycisphaerae bacterium]